MILELCVFDDNVKKYILEQNVIVEVINSFVPENMWAISKINDGIIYKVMQYVDLKYSFRHNNQDIDVFASGVNVFDQDNFGGNMVFLPCNIATFVNENEEGYLESDIKYILDGMEEFKIVDLTEVPEKYRI